MFHFNVIYMLILYFYRFISLIKDFTSCPINNVSWGGEGGGREYTNLFRGAYIEGMWTPPPKKGKKKKEEVRKMKEERKVKTKENETKTSKQRLTWKEFT